ncbi:hypothetical protein BKA62DRAFT_764844 [Auriculariales sp. MPI-PUGE-AT-0066]|nr:hypothetical protein BKA62DRAFT_764844 [Auriculariales sp. MPI-PUGE-AT-0066]
MTALISALFAAALFAGQAAAQTLDQHSFGFKFAGSTAIDIVQCDIIPLATIPLNNTVAHYGKPPYKVLAFEAGGVSDSQDGGSNSSYIPWEVRHAAGARIWLSIIDDNGDYAGFPTHYITVLKGAEDCMPKLPDNLPRITANVSETTLNTCQEWGMTITGGVPPYSVQIIAEDSPVYTNVTAPDTQTDRFTYANRADPGRHMIVSVSDQTGQFGYSSQPVLTKGSTNTTCPGVNSSWRRAAAVELEMQEAAKIEAERREAQKRTTIIAAVVSVIGFILLCVLSFFIWRKVVASRAGVKKGQPGFDMEPVTAYFPPPTASPNPQMSQMSQMSQMQGEPPITPFTSSHHLLTRQPSTASGMFSPYSSYSQRDELPPLPVPDFDPYAMVGATTPANRKAMEAAAERRAALARDGSLSGHSYSNSHSGPNSSFGYYQPQSVSGASSGVRRGPSSVTGSVAQESQSAPSVVGTDDDGAIIVQHRDGGVPQPVVFELPPSYDPGSYRRPPSGMPGGAAYPPEKGRRQ